MTILSQSTGMVGRDLRVNAPFTIGSHLQHDSPLSRSEVDRFCSVFTVSQGGTVLFGGNIDLRLGEISDKELNVTFFPAYEGYGFVTLGREWHEKGDGSRTHTNYSVGMNEKRLTFAGSGVPLTSLSPHPERPFSGSIGDFKVKAMRECSNVASVIELAQNFNFGDSLDGQLHFADSAGDAVVISAGKDGELAFTRKEKGNGFLVSTNFNLADPESGSYPCWRYDTATEMLEEIGSEHDLTIDYAAIILEATHVEGMRVNTAVSYVFNLKNGDIYLYYVHQFNDAIRMNFEEKMAEIDESFQSSGSIFSAPVNYEIHNSWVSYFIFELFPEEIIKIGRCEIQGYKREYYLCMAVKVIVVVVILSGLSLFSYKRVKNLLKKT